VRAADADNQYAIWGPGESSCNAYNQARAADDAGKFKSYTMGYLTAYNTFVPDTYSITHSMDIDAVIAWLDGYCQKNQIETFESALHQLIEEMKEQRQKTSPANAARWP